MTIARVLVALVWAVVAGTVLTNMPGAAVFAATTGADREAAGLAAAPAACASLTGPGQIPSPTIITFDDLPAGTSIGEFYRRTHGVSFEEGRTRRVLAYDHPLARSAPMTALSDTGEDPAVVPLRFTFDALRPAWACSRATAAVRRRPAWRSMPRQPNACSTSSTARRPHRYRLRHTGDIASAVPSTGLRRRESMTTYQRQPCDRHADYDSILRPGTPTCTPPALCCRAVHLPGAGRTRRPAARLRLPGPGQPRLRWPAPPGEVTWLRCRRTRGCARRPSRRRPIRLDPARAGAAGRRPWPRSTPYRRRWSWPAPCGRPARPSTSPRNLAAGDLRLDHAGRAVVGLPRGGRQLHRELRGVPGDRPLPLGSTADLRATNLLLGRVTGAATAASARRRALFRPPIAQMDLRLLLASLPSGSAHQPTGRISPAPQDRWLAQVGLGLAEGGRPQISHRPGRGSSSPRTAASARLQRPSPLAATRPGRRRATGRSDAVHRGSAPALPCRPSWACPSTPPSRSKW